MDQKGFSGRDLTQIGRDFTQKLFELNLSHKNSSQIHILNQNNSEINAYLSLWEKLNHEQKVKIAINYIEEIEESINLSLFQENIQTAIFWVGTAVLSCTLYLLMLNPVNRSFIEKTEYSGFKSMVSTYCKFFVAKDKIPPAICFSVQKSSESAKYETLIKTDFESYRNTGLGFSIFWLGVPAILAGSASLLGYPIAHFFQSKVKEANQAKTQTARILFNLLTDYEQSLVRDNVSDSKLKKISSTTEMISNLLSRKLELEKKKLELEKKKLELETISPIPDIKDYYEIYLSNQTGVRLAAAIRYENLNNVWITGGWYHLDPEDSFLVAQTRNENYFFYAESTAELGNRNYWGGSDLSLPIRESDCNYGFIEVKVNRQSWGPFTQSLTIV